MIGRNGVKNNKRPIGLSILCLIILGVIYILNDFDISFRLLPLWIQISIPALLIIGFLGCLLKRRIFSIFGMIGSLLFVMLVVLMGYPDRDHYSFYDLQYPGGAYVLTRFLFLLSVAVSLLVCFGLVAKWSKRNE